MAKRLTKAEKQTKQAFDDSFRRLGNGVQINIMDLSKVQNESLAAAATGISMDDAVAAAIAKYRQN